MKSVGLIGISSEGLAHPLHLPLFLPLKQLIRLQRVDCTERPGYHIPMSAFTFVTEDLGSHGRINIHKASLNKSMCELWRALAGEQLEAFELSVETV